MASKIYLFLMSILVCIDLTQAYRENPEDEYEVWPYKVSVIPIIRNTSKTSNGKSPDNIIFDLLINDRNYTLNLKKDDILFHRDYVEKYYNEQGGEVITPRKVDCFYRGTLLIDDNIVPSVAIAANTCNGSLSASVISSRTASFNVDPDQVAESFSTPHIVYFDSDYKNDYIRRKKRSLVESRSSDNNTVYVELYTVIDTQLYNAHGKNRTEVVIKAINIVNNMNALFAAMNVRVIMVGCEVWTDVEHIPKYNPSNTKTILDAFGSYRVNKITPKHHNDHAQLFSGKRFHSSLMGLARYSLGCGRSSISVIRAIKSRAIKDIANVATHELAHALGMRHVTGSKRPYECKCEVNVELCSCSPKICVMSAIGYPGRSVTWSQCSYKQMKRIRLKKLEICMLNIPEKSIPDKGYNLCGNGNLDDGEQCDCGLVCDELQANCCDAATCMFKANATCSSGLCCDSNTCKVKEMASKCRNISDTCDLPEHCDGESEFCPDDYYLKDGTSCITSTDEQSFCYKKQCRTRLTHCQMLYGPLSTVHVDCFSKNARNSPIGGCGTTPQGRRKTCLRKDMMCGSLYCNMGGGLQFWGSSAGIIKKVRWYYNKEYVKCITYTTNVPKDGRIRDYGMVPDGAPCPTGVCINSTCQPITVLSESEKCPNCNDHGRCNNINECHCERGYSPPSCVYSGRGGSLKGGPLNKDNNEEELKLLLAGIFIIVIPSLIIATMYARWRFLTATPEETSRGNYSICKFCKAMFTTTPSDNICEGQSIDLSS